MNKREKVFMLWALGASVLDLVLLLAVLTAPGSPNPPNQPISTRPLLSNNTPSGLVAPTLLPLEGSSIELGGAGEFFVGSVTRVQFRAHILPEDPRPNANQWVIVWLVSNERDDYLAFYGFDPFRGCRIGWNEGAQRFEDPCHGSKYTRAGKYIEGPSPRALDHFKVWNDNGSIILDLHLIRGEPRP